MRYSQILVFLVLAIACRYEGNSNANETQAGSWNEQNTSSRIELIETILNMPKVKQFSKTELIWARYDSVFFFVEGDSFKHLVPVYQDGNIVSQKMSIAKINPNEVPCYVFKKLQVDDNKAFVRMHFDITGAIAYGELLWVDGAWSPKEDFVVGVR